MVQGMKIGPDEQIITDRCRLRYPTQADFPEIWSATRHQGFNDGMVWDPPLSMKELHEPLQRSHAAWADGTEYTWTVESRNDHEFIGRIAIRQTDGKHEWSLGYWTHPSVQKRGYASEATVAVIEFGFSKLGALRITAAHATWNEASAKVLTRAGMKKTGINPKGFKKNGSWVEEYEYEILRDESC